MLSAPSGAEEVEVGRRSVARGFRACSLARGAQCLMCKVAAVQHVLYKDIYKQTKQASHTYTCSTQRRTLPRSFALAAARGTLPPLCEPASKSAARAWAWACAGAVKDAQVRHARTRTPRTAAP